MGIMVRVELHNAGYQQYTALHENLGKVGMHNMIRADNGQWYQLPPAEYQYYGLGNAAFARSLAAGAAALTGCNYGVVASEGTAVYWQGLTPIQ